MSSTKRTTVDMSQHYQEVQQQLLQDFPFQLPELARLITLSFHEKHWTRLHLVSKRLRLLLSPFKTTLKVNIETIDSVEEEEHTEIDLCPPTSFVLLESRKLKLPLYNLSFITQLTLTWIQQLISPYDVLSVKRNKEFKVWRKLLRQVRPHLTNLSIDAALLAGMYHYATEGIEFPNLIHLHCSLAREWWEALSAILSPSTFQRCAYTMLTAPKLTHYTGGPATIDLYKSTALQTLIVPHLHRNCDHFVHRDIAAPLCQLKNITQLHLEGLATHYTEHVIDAIDALPDLKTAFLSFNGTYHRSNPPTSDFNCDLDAVFAVVERHPRAKFAIQCDFIDCNWDGDEDTLQDAFTRHTMDNLVCLHLLNVGEKLPLGLDFLVARRFDALTVLKVSESFHLFDTPTRITPEEFVSGALAHQKTLFPVLMDFVFTTSFPYTDIHTQRPFAGRIISHILSSPRIMKVKTDCFEIFQAIALFAQSVRQYLDTCDDTTNLVTHLPRCHLSYHICEDQVPSLTACTQAHLWLQDLKEINFFRGLGDGQRSLVAIQRLPSDCPCGLPPGF